MRFAAALLLVLAITAQATNWVQCGEDVFNLLPQLKQLESDVSSKNVEGVITDLQNIIGQAQTISTDCGLNINVTEIVSQAEVAYEEGSLTQCIENAEQIAQIVEQIAQSSGNVTQDIANIEAIAQLIPSTIQACNFQNSDTVSTNWVQCGEDVLNALPQLKQLVSDVESQNWEAVLGDVQNLIPTLQTISTDCGINANVSQAIQAGEAFYFSGSFSQCIEYAEQIAQIAEGVIQSPSNVSNDISAVEQLVQLLPQALQACNFSTAATEVTTIETNYIQCAEDIFNSLPELEQLVNDVKSKNVDAILNDLTTIVGDIQNIASACGLNVSVIQDYEAFEAEGDFNQCIQIAEQIAGYAEEVIQSPNNITQDISAVESIISLIPQAQSACNFSAPPTIIEENYIQCAEDVINTIPNLKQLVTDIQSKNVINIIGDLDNLVPQIQSVSTDCGFNVNITAIITELENDYFNGDFTQCISNAEKLVVYVKEIINNPSNITQDISAVQSIVQLAPQTIASCKIPPSVPTTNFLALGENVEIELSFF